MPQTYPMNWFLYSFIICILLSMSNQAKIFSKNSKNNMKHPLVLKNVKWMW